MYKEIFADSAIKMMKDERNMKKTLIAILLLLTMVLSFASCGGKNVDLSKADMSKYVELGDYLGVAVTVDAQKTVADADVKAVVDKLIASKATETTTPVTDRAAAEGDTLTVDFAGTMDGVAFEGGTASDQALTIGENRYIEGFEEGMIGANVGDVVTLNLNFPEDYQTKPEYSGKPVTFAVTVKEINTVTSTLPEYNDAFVVENTDYETVAEYETAVRTGLEESAATAHQNAINSAVWKVVFANAAIKELPTANVDNFVKTMVEYYEYMRYLYVQNYGIDEATAESLIPIDEDEIRKEAETDISNDIVMYAIAAAQNWQLTDAEYSEGGLKYAQKNSYTTLDELFENTSINETNLRKALLWDKVIENVVAAADVTVK